MKTLRFALLFSAAALTSGVLRADHVAPRTFANTIFNATLTGSTGTTNGNGTFSLFFTAAGFVHTVNPTGTPVTDAVTYTYTRTGEQTATVAEALPGGGTLNIDLTFTATAMDNAGTFTANYGDGRTQSGSFLYIPVPAPAPLLNMSNRAMVPAGGNTIAGLVVSGAVPRRVLVRAVGPGLASFGVTSVLADPQLTLFRAGEALASNDNWSTTAADRTALAAAFTQAGAFGLTDGSNDAAIVVTLAPGVYTNVVSGSGGAGGAVLLETYFLD